MRRGINRKSLSLIEVSIAMIIFAIVSGQMFRVFHEGFKVGRKSEERTLAYSLAREEIEGLFFLGPNLFLANNICTRPGCSDSYCPCQITSLVIPPDEARVVVAGFAGIEREVDVVHPYLTINGLSHIKVTVWWDNRKEYEFFETLKANY